MAVRVAKRYRRRLLKNSSVRAHASLAGLAAVERDPGIQIGAEPDGQTVARVYDSPQVYSVTVDLPFKYLSRKSWIAL